MSEKQMYFKVRFENWDAYNENLKNFIKFYIKDSTIISGQLSVESDSFPACMLSTFINQYASNGQSGIIYKYNTDNYEQIQGFVQHSLELGNSLTGKPGIYNKLADITILPTVGNKVNTDASTTQITQDGVIYTYSRAQSISECDWKYRTSSFSIQYHDNDSNVIKTESVHFKIGTLVVDLENNTVLPPSDEEDDITNFVMNISYTDIRLFSFGNTSYTAYSFITEQSKFPYRAVSQPDVISNICVYFYIELCKDGGEYYDNTDIPEYASESQVLNVSPMPGVNKSNIFVGIMDSDSNELRMYDYLECEIVKSSSNDYLAGTTGHYQNV